MKNVRPQTDAILDGLKDFQRDTVEYIFQRMYLDSDFARRFLLADEVGLGKTLVARGLIAKAIDYLWDPLDELNTEANVGERLAVRNRFDELCGVGQIAGDRRVSLPRAGKRSRTKSTAG